MTGTDDNQLTQDIRQVLDANPPDAETRKALQLARARALTPEQKRTWRMPWLEFAVSAALVAVLALALPRQPTAVKPPQAVAAVKPTPAASATATKPALNTTPATVAADADLLENLELYEDAEFYQWLSEQDGEGAQDA
jgi:hypothetical protein